MSEAVEALSRELARALARLSRLERMVAVQIRPGTIHEVKADEYRARVRLSDGGGEPFLSPPRPWATVAGANARDWTVPEAGQQVLVFSPSGVLGQSLILPLGFSDQMPPPSTAADERLMLFGASRFAMRDDAVALHAATFNVKGKTLTDGEVRLGKPGAEKRVMLEDGSPAERVYAF